MNQDYVSRQEYRDLEQRVGKIENRLTRTETRLDSIEQILTKIDDNTTWLKQAYIKGVIGFLTTVGAGLLLWLVTK